MDQSTSYYKSQDNKTSLDIYNEILSICDSNKNITAELAEDYFKRYVTKIKELIAKENYEFVYKLKSVIQKNCYLVITRKTNSMPGLCTR